MSATARVGITERAAQRIVADLVHTGYLARLRARRRNTYEVHAAAPPRHAFASGISVVARVEALGAAPRTEGGQQ